MAKKLYVGGLSYNTTDGALKEFFSQAGTVETATVIIDRMSNRSNFERNLRGSRGFSHINYLFYQPIGITIFIIIPGKDL